MRKRLSSKFAQRGQVEIMGLMIIVVILSLALLFVVKVVFTQQKTNYAQEHESSKLVESFVNTLFQTTSACASDTTIQELLIDCAKNPGYGTLICDDGRDSCTFANETIGVILDETIDVWGYGASGYEFIATVPPHQELVYHTEGDISSSMGGEVEPFTLRLYPSTQDLYVYLCLGGCGFR